MLTYNPGNVDGLVRRTRRWRRGGVGGTGRPGLPCLPPVRHKPRTSTLDPARRLFPRSLNAPGPPARVGLETAPNTSSGPEPVAGLSR